MSDQDVAALSGLSLRAKVQRLAGCLSDLPERLRLVLEMRAGIATGRPLSITAVSRELHVTVGQARRLQRRALRMLFHTARSQGCGTSTEAAAGYIAGFGTAALDAVAAPFGAAGGVLAAHYSKSPSPGRSRPEATQAGIAGANPLDLGRPGGGAGTLLAVAIVLSGTLLIAILFAEQLGLGPHFRRLRSRWLRRPPR